MAAIPGSASAHAVFYGCSRVCTHSPGTNRTAVVAKNGECECRELTPSDRKDPAAHGMPGDDVICYEAAPDEVVVGLIYYSGGECVYIENTNRCAESKIDCGCEDC